MSNPYIELLDTDGSDDADEAEVRLGMAVRGSDPIQRAKVSRWSSVEAWNEYKRRYR